MVNIQGQLLAARKVATPLIGIRTDDPEATISWVSKVCCNGGGMDSIPLMEWDCVTGLAARNQKGVDAITSAFRDAGISTDDIAAYTNDPERTLDLLKWIAPKSMAFMLNIHRFINQPTVSQAVWNLRKTFKESRMTLVMLYPSITLPEELRYDIRQFEEPVPTDYQISDMLQESIEAVESAGIPAPPEDVKPRLIEGLRGLPIFAAEQTIFESMSSSGISVESVMDRSRSLINSIDGLTFHYEHSDGFDEIGGCEEIKFLFNGIFNGPEPPDLILMIDEGEKTFAGAGRDSQGDSSGVSQDAVSYNLQMFEDNKIEGSVFLGHPGAGKSFMCRCLAKQFGRKFIQLDFGKMQGSLVGESQKKIRSAWDTILALGGERIFAVMTMNSIGNVPPELMARFPYGPYFFDTPTAEEKYKIWHIHMRSFGLLNEHLTSLPEWQSHIPDDDGWVGRDIRNCCRMAYRLGISLHDAAKRIVPATKADPEATANRRRMAHNRFLDSSRPGVYRDPSQEKQELRVSAPSSGRMIDTLA